MLRMTLGPGMVQEMWLGKSVCFHQCRSLQVLCGGECGMKGLSLKMAMKFCKLLGDHCASVTEFAIQLLCLLEVVCLFGLRLCEDIWFSWILVWRLFYF